MKIEKNGFRLFWVKENFDSGSGFFTAL